MPYIYVAEFQLSSRLICRPIRSESCQLPFVGLVFRGVDPIWDSGNMSPNIYEGDGVHGNLPQYFRSDVVVDVDSSDHQKLCPDPKESG